MHTNTLNTPLFSTSSFGDSTDTLTTESSALGEHLTLCKALTGRLFTARCAAEAMHGFVASRFVTTLVAAATLLGVSSFIG
jgi:hypothetical protein